jgi:RimJ/RimL family protein N-acetyltransferase
MLEFRKTLLPQDAAALWHLDVEIFGTDAFPPEDWLTLESYWIVVDAQIAGCAAFIHDVDFGEDLEETGENVPQRGTLYIQSTGLRPQFRGKGLGGQVKAWQIDYARRHGFHRIVTNCRASNSAMISINKKFGFQPIRTTPGYYADGEPTVVMELILR